MSSRSGPEETLTLPTELEQQADDAPVAAMDAKLMVAKGSGDVQQLKDLVKKQEQDSKMMVVVMAKQQAAASAEKAQQGNMDPHLLALASSGDYKKLKSLLFREDSQVFKLHIQQAYDTAEDRQACADGVEGVAAEGGSEASADGVEGSLPMRQASGDIVEANELIQEGIPIIAEGHTSSVCASSFLNPEEGQACAKGTDGSLHMRQACDDIEANELILEGVTVQGDTALHVVAASCGQGQDDALFFTTCWPWTWNWPCLTLTRAARHALSLSTSSFSDDRDRNFLESARIIYWKAKHLLFVQNNNGDTPLNCAARAGKSNMVKCLIQLALGEGEGRVKALLRKENKDKETALHEAVRVGNMDIVDLLMEEDSELASIPQDGGASPMYLAIILKLGSIAVTLHEKSHGKFSFSGPNGQNVLHASVAAGWGGVWLLEWNKSHLCPQNKDLTTQRDENGSTPLHFAAAIKLILEFSPTRICSQILKVNPDALYQPDHAGFFPIHVAASVDASSNVDMFVKRYPGSAGLRDAKGRTFLHVAVEKRKRNVIRSACRNLSLSWIMNMVDSDGNTALHLAVEAGSLRMFCALLGNSQVNLNLPNNRGETPLDIAEYKIPDDGLFYNQNSEALIRLTLRTVGAVKGVRRGDHLKDNKTRKVKSDETKKLEVLKDTTGAMCIVSVLIATVTFGATFAVPGGYIADDHSNGGSPILSRRYAFDAFIASNTLAFVFSTMATIALMYSGSPAFNPQSRGMHLRTAFYLVCISLTCLAAAFALGAYVVLAPVAHKTAVATCILTSLVLLYKNLEFIWRRLLLLPPLCTRKGLIWAWAVSASAILGNMLYQNWPLIFIFGWAAYANPAPTLQAAPAQAPVPLA